MIDKSRHQQNALLGEGVFVYCRYRADAGNFGTIETVETTINDEREIFTVRLIDGQVVRALIGDLKVAGRA